MPKGNELRPLFSRFLRNRSYILKTAFKYAGVIYAILEFVSIFASMDELLRSFVKSLNSGQEPSIVILICFSLVFFAFIFIVSCIIVSLVVVLKRRYKLFDTIDGHHVFVQYGNIFDPAEVLDPNKRRNIVIPVNRCFDTKVDDKLISSNTLQGQAMKKLYSDGLYTEETLAAVIKKKLRELEFTEDVRPEKISRKDKHSGELKRYPPGTVVEIETSDKCVYFLLALSRFDNRLHAGTSDEEYVLALIHLLEYCNAYSQGFPVVMPLIGGGASETNKEEQDILEYLTKFIKINKTLINCDIHIVVRDTARDVIGIANL